MQINRNTKLSDLPFSVRAFNYLHKFNATTLGELTALTSLESPVIYLSGSKAERQILRLLENLGLKLGMNEQDWILIEEKHIELENCDLLK